MDLRNIRELVGANHTWAPESLARRKATSQKRAGLGVWAATRHQGDRAGIVAWKKRGPDATGAAAYAAAIAGLIRDWSGATFTQGVFLTVPPQGASSPGPYAAELVARHVAEVLGLPFFATLVRTDEKRCHGPWSAMQQAPYRTALPPAGHHLALVVDDLVTSGATLRLSLEALRSKGLMAFGFAYSGC